MGYRLLQFMCGKDRPQGYVLQGDGEHEGTNEPISPAEMMANATNAAKLAAFLDYRFKRAHGERRQAEHERDMMVHGQHITKDGKRVDPADFYATPPA